MQGDEHNQLQLDSRSPSACNLIVAERTFIVWGNLLDARDVISCHVRLWLSSLNLCQLYSLYNVLAFCLFCLLLCYIPSLEVLDFGGGLSHLWDCLIWLVRLALWTCVIWVSPFPLQKI